MASKSPYLAPSLKDKGYTGVTGSTPYRAPTPQETATLQHIYEDTSFEKTRYQFDSYLRRFNGCQRGFLFISANASQWRDAA